MQNLTKNLRNLEPVGFSRGGCATVHKAVLYSDNGQKSQIVAVKFPNLHNIETCGDTGYVQDRAKVLRRWKREIRAGQGVSHPNILPFLGFYNNPNEHYGFDGLILPYCENGDASMYVRRHLDADRMRILTEVGAALFAIHSARPPVVHGDIKAQNILIDNEGHALLADFGLSRICETSGFTTDSVMGSCRWMAVELLRGEDIRTCEATDIWAFAMTILEILTGKLPFNELKKDCYVLLQIVNNARRPKRPSGSCIPSGLWTLLEHCWHQDASARPDARHVGLALDLISQKAGGQLDSRAIVAILEGVYDAPLKHSRCSQSTALPYKCKWLHCNASFDDLDNLIAHECDEFVERMTRA